MAGLLLRGIKKTYGTVKVLHGIDLDIKSGEFIVFVGPSGCGKSTLLRLIAGLEDITGGTLQIDGQVVNQLAPSKRGIAMVFQSYALYPHMTVYDNMAFGMKLGEGPEPRRDRQARARGRAISCRSRPISTACRSSSPAASASASPSAAPSSAIRRCSCSTSRFPISTRRCVSQTRIEINKLHERMAGVTMIYVTHDQVEAMTLADRIVVLNAGRVEQVGAPMELYHQPDNLFVARFLGSPSMNTIPCTIVSGGADAAGPARWLRHDRGGGDYPGQRRRQASGTFGVRPEDLVLTDGPDAIFRGTIDIVEQLGEVTLIYVDVGTSEPIVAKIENEAVVARGQKVSLTTEKRHLHVFDENGIAFPRS